MSHSEQTEAVIHIDNRRNIPFMPTAKLFSELGVNFLQKGKVIRNGYVDIESDCTFKQDQPFTRYNTETGTSRYWLLNSGVGADLVSKEGKKWASIYITGMNLTNIACQSFLSRLRYEAVNNVTGRVGVFDMGRNFSFKVNVPLDYKLKGK